MRQPLLLYRIIIPKQRAVQHTAGTSYTSIPYVWYVGYDTYLVIGGKGLFVCVCVGCLLHFMFVWRFALPNNLLAYLALDCQSHCGLLCLFAMYYF